MTFGENVSKSRLSKYATDEYSNRVFNGRLRDLTSSKPFRNYALPVYWIYVGLLMPIILTIASGIVYEIVVYSGISVGITIYVSDIDIRYVYLICVVIFFTVRLALTIVLPHRYWTISQRGGWWTYLFIALVWIWIFQSDDPVFPRGLLLSLSLLWFGCGSFILLLAMIPRRIRLIVLAAFSIGVLTLTVWQFSIVTNQLTVQSIVEITDLVPRVASDSTVPIGRRRLFGVVFFLIILILTKLDLEMSHVRSAWRAVTHRFRKDSLIYWISPTLVPPRYLSFIHYLNRVGSTKNWYNVVPIVVLVAGCFALIAPITRATLDHDSLLLSASVVILIIMVLLLNRLLLSVQKVASLSYVSKFEVDVPELAGFAELLTHTLVDQIRIVSLMMQVNQREIVELAEGVRCGIDMNLDLDHILLSDLEKATLFEPIGIFRQQTRYTIVDRLLQRIARTHVQGRMQSHRSRIHLHISVRHRGVSYLAQYTIDSTDNEHNLEDFYFSSAMRELVLRLIHVSVKLPFSSLEALSHFIQGREAGLNGQWWLALEHYIQSAQVDEAAGVGGQAGELQYYHLGMIHILQRNWEEALAILRVAEASEHPRIELLYAIALAETYFSWDNLDQDHSSFDNLVGRIETILRKRPGFAEAQSLFAFILYRRVQLLENDTSVENGQRGNRLKQLAIKRTNLNKALHYSRGAYVNHWKHIVCLHHEMRTRDYYRNLKSRVDYQVDIYAIALRQTADVLNMLGFFAEANTYDKELADLFSLKDFTIAKWDATTALELGQKLVEDSQYSTVKDFIIYLTRKEGSQVSYSGSDVSVSHLPKSAMYLDYALYQRPDYIVDEKAKNNLRSLTFICQRHSSLSALESYFDIDRVAYPSDLIDETTNYTLFWLVMRLDLLGFFAPENVISSSYYPIHDSYPILAEMAALVDRGKLSLKRDSESYKQYKRLRRKLLSVLSKTYSGNLAPQGKAYNLLVLGLASDFLNCWLETEKEREEFESYCTNGQSQLSAIVHRRWQLDFWLDIAQVTVRLFVEASAYELAFEVASQALGMVDAWKTKHGRNDDSQFALMTLRVQYANLVAWRLYCLFQMCFDTTTKSRCKVIAENSHVAERTWRYFFEIEPNWSNSEVVTDSIIRDLTAIYEVVPDHPLGLFVDALVLSKQQQYGVAIEKSITLTQHTDVSDHSFETVNSTVPHATMRQTSNEFPEHWLGLLAHVTGQYQFTCIVNHYNVHIFLANMYEKIGQLDLAIAHVQRSLHQTSYPYFTVEGMLRLSAMLIASDRHNEALAVLNQAEAIVNRSSINIDHNLEQKMLVMRCTILVHLGHYMEALDVIERLLHHPDAKNLPILERIDSVEDDIRAQNLAVDQNGKPFFIVDETISGFHSNARRYKEILNLMFALDTEPHASLQVCYAQLVELTANTLNVTAATRTLSSTVDVFLQSHFIDSRAKDKLLNFFTSLNSELSRGLDSFAHAATINLNDTARRLCLSTDTFKKNKHDVDLFPEASPDISRRVNLVIRTHLYELLSEVAIDQLECFAEMCISLAFLEIETNRKHGQPYLSSAMAVVVGTFLANASERTSKNGSRYWHSTARYFDVLGWVHFREAMRLEPEPEVLSDSLHLAEYYLRQGLGYNPSLATIHYHLSRVYLALLENAWGHFSNDSRDVSRNDASEIHVFLSLALREWRLARDLDKIGRLENQLSWIRDKLESYRKAWEMYFFNQSRTPEAEN